jgi:CheY-like chemotaxis protein
LTLVIGQAEGSGLGLSMIYGFAKQSGGHVEIVSELGEGTTVKVYLPRSRVEGSELPSQSPTPAAEEPHGDGEMILVVEDDSGVRALVVRLLSQLGYRVLQAGDATTALQIYHAAPQVDGLLTDVILPGGTNGVELARELHRRRPELPVLFTSGYTENELIHEGRLDLGVELLEKPYRKAELARMVHALIERGGSA